MVVFEYAAGLILFRYAPELHAVVEYLLLYSNWTRMWTPPGGCVRNESFLEAAIRNTQEQTGLFKTNMVIVDTFSQIFKDVNGQNTTVYFVGKLKDENTPIRLNYKNQAYLWLSLADAANIVKNSVYRAMKKAGIIETMLKPLITQISKSIDVSVQNK